MVKHDDLKSSLDIQDQPSPIYTNIFKATFQSNAPAPSKYSGGTEFSLSLLYNGADGDRVGDLALGVSCWPSTGDVRRSTGTSLSLSSSARCVSTRAKLGLKTGDSVPVEERASMSDSRGA